MEILAKYSSQCLKHFGRGALLLLVSVAAGFAQKLPQPTRVWSVGPLTKSEPVMGIAFGAGGATVTGPHVDSQTGSVFAATRSVVFAGDRIVLASMVGMRRVEDAQNPEEVYQLLSLDEKTGEVKDSREFVGFGVRAIFATNDAHVIISGTKVLRLTPDLKDDDSFDFHATGHRFGQVENVSPDGTTLGSETSPGFELIDARTLKTTELTASPAVDTSVSTKGFVTDNVHWIRDYPKDLAFITYTDAAGEHLLYHGKCSGRPQFLSDNLVLEPGCKSPLIVDTHGNPVRKLFVKGEFSYAGVSQNSKRICATGRKLFPHALDQARAIRHLFRRYRRLEIGRILGRMAGTPLGTVEQIIRNARNSHKTNNGPPF